VYFLFVEVEQQQSKTSRRKAHKSGLQTVQPTEELVNVPAAVVDEPQSSVSAQVPEQLHQLQSSLAAMGEAEIGTDFTVHSISIFFQRILSARRCRKEAVEEK